MRELRMLRALSSGPARTHRPRDSAEAGTITIHMSQPRPAPLAALNGGDVRSARCCADYAA